MKTRTIIIFAVMVVVVFIIISSCATNRKAISEEEFYRIFSGVWINPENEGEFAKWQKNIAYPDGTIENYKKLDDEMPALTVKLTITDIWRDREGNIWYKGTWLKVGQHGEMGKFSEGGDIYERLVSLGPLEEWEPNKSGYYYFTFYRQE